MKILYLIHRLDGTDGWSRYGLDLARSIKEQGHEALCLVSEKTGEAGLAQEAVLGQPLQYIANPLAARRLARRVRPVLAEFRPDIIHFIVEPYAAILPWLGAKAGKSVLTVHGTYAAGHLLFTGLKKKLAFYQANQYYKRVNALIAVSDFTKKHALKYFPFLDGKISVITNGVNFRELGAEPAEAKSDKQIKNILFVGTVRPRKGIIEAVEALDYYRDHYRGNFQFDIIGNYGSDPGYTEALKNKIKDKGLAGKIFLRGIVSEEELDRYYRAADLLLMLARNDGIAFEGFGLVYLEANARGVPVIGATGSGALEAVKDGFSGYSAAPDKPAEAAKKIDLILNKNAISRADCLAWARENDVRVKVKQILDIYRL